MKKLLISVFISALTFANAYAQEPTQEQKDMATALKFLTSQQIISGIEGKELAKALDGISRMDNMRAVSGIALEVTDKLIGDKGNLLFILSDIEKLASEKYSSKLGGITPESLMSAKEKLVSLAADMESGRPVFKDAPKPLNIDNYREMLKKNRIFLTGETPEVTTPAKVWEKILEAISGAYPEWLKKHTELAAKVNDNPDKKQEELLTNEELLFAKTFSRVKLYRYMLSQE